MILEELQITNLRNIHSARLSLHPKFNIITGANGSGKTSFLEAIYLLASGHSFRTREISALISHSKDSLTVFCKTSDSQRISIQKSGSLGTIARINGNPCLSSSKLATLLPTLVFYQDIFNLIDAGPGLRRGLLDWGLFHVKHDYLVLWKDYRRALKQRNALLKQRATLLQLSPWNHILNELALKLDGARKLYFQEVAEQFDLILKELTSIDCELHYYRGWDRKNEGKTLEDILNASYQIDLARQFTHYGAHQADLLVVSKQFKVKHFLSRGQQKVVLFALKFAQARLAAKSCIYLLDDLDSELDEEHVQKILNYISEMQGQFFITLRSNSQVLELIKKPHSLFLMNKGGFDPEKKS